MTGDAFALKSGAGDNLLARTWRSTGSYERNARKQVTSEVDEKGRVTKYTYVPGTYRIASVTLPDGGVRTTTWNDYAEPLVETDQLGRTTVHTYDAKGNRLSRTDASGTADAGTWT